VKSGDKFVKTRRLSDGWLESRITHRSLHRRRLLQPGSVALSLSPQKHFHALCLRGREQAVLWQHLDAEAA